MTISAGWCHPPELYCLCGLASAIVKSGLTDSQDEKSQSFFNFGSNSIMYPHTTLLTCATHQVVFKLKGRIVVPEVPYHFGRL